MVSELLYQIDIIKNEDFGYTVLVPSLPGCVSSGDTIEEATENAKEAIGLHLENIKTHNGGSSIKNNSSIFSTMVKIKSSYA